MDFSNLLNNIKSSLKAIWEKILDFIKNNKMVSMIAGVLILLVILLIIIISSSSKSKNKNKTVQINPDVLVLTETPVIPDGPDMESDYNISRKTEDKWNDSEADEWFTVPSEKEIDSLSVSNENMIKGIIGAAP